MSDTSTIRSGRGPHFCDLPYELQDDPDTTPSHIATYLSLRRFADFGGIRGARASHATLAGKAHVSVDTLQRSLLWLKGRGWIEWDSGREAGKPNDYTVHRSLVPSEGGGTAPDGEGVPHRTGRGVPHQTGTTESHIPRAITEKHRPATSAGDSTNGKPNGVSRKTWLTPYFDVWHDRFGKDAAFPAGQIARALKPIHDRIGPVEVCRRFAYFLRVTKAEYLNVPKFAATFGDWDPANEPMSSLGIPEDAWGDVQRQRR